MRSRRRNGRQPASGPVGCRLRVDSGRQFCRSRGSDTHSRRRVSMSGRVGRVEWWTTFIIANIASAWAVGLLYRGLLADGQGLADASLQSTILLGLGHAAILAIALVVQRNISIRRAHDRDVRPIAFWAYAATSMVSAAVSFGASTFDGSLPFNPAWIWVPQVVAWAWVAIEFGARPGDPVANRWGPVPKHPFDVASPRIDNYRPPRN